MKTTSWNLSARWRLILRLLLALSMLPGLHVLQRSLERDRVALGAGLSVELRNAPPFLVFITAAGGGCRGVIANLLWLRATRLQDEGRFFELYTLADWITKLQPEFSSVWAVQAWNMGWNISRQFTDPADRWLWIRSSMELIRDEALRYNPRDPLLYRELSWLFLDKIGRYTDEGHRYYKKLWAAEMKAVLGSDVSPGELASLRTPEAQERVAILSDKYRMDVGWMKRVDEYYGPLDWRTAEAHALYWATVGLSHCKASSQDLLPLRRAVWQSLQMAFAKGRLIQNRSDGELDFGPNLDLVPNVNFAFDQMRQQDPERSAYVGRSQMSFLRDAIYLLYTHDRMADAAMWFQYVKTNFVAAIPTGLGLDEFVVREVTGDLAVANPMRIRGILEGILGHYIRSQSVGEDDEANGHALLARRIWESFQARKGASKNVTLAPLADIERDVRERMAQELRRSTNGALATPSVTVPGAPATGTVPVVPKAPVPR